MFLSFDSTQTPAVKVWNLVNTITGGNSVQISLEDDCAPIQVIILGGTATNVNVTLPSNPPPGKILSFRVENNSTGNTPNVILLEGNTSVSSISSSQSVQLVYITSPITLAGGSSTNWIVLSGATSSRAGSNSGNLIAGGIGHKINSPSGGPTFIGGGQGHTVQNGYAFIGGGLGNQANFVAAVAGGQGNSASNQHSFVGAGVSNNASGQTSAIAGGSSNTSGSTRSFVGAGTGNSVFSGGDNSTIVGGRQNSTYGPLNFIGGGNNNSISTSQWSSVIGGGEYNTNTQSVGSIVGGHSNTQSAPSSITTASATITNSSANTPFSMAISADNSSVAIGQYVSAGGNGDLNFINAIVTGYTPQGSAFATTGGSWASNVATITHAGGTYAVGSWVRISDVTPSTYNGDKLVTASSAGSISFGTGTTLTPITVQGTIRQATTVVLNRRPTTNGGVTAHFWKAGSFIGGGVGNTASGYNSVVVGGGYDGTTTNGNTATGDRSFIGAGYKNTTSGANSVISGGQQNSISGGDSAFIGAGLGNSIGYNYGAIGGGRGNVVSYAAGAIMGGAYGSTRNAWGYHAFPACYAPITFLAGVSQGGMLVVARETTDATPAILRSEGSAPSANNQLSLPNNSAYYFTGSVIAGVTGAGNTKAWKFEGAIKRGANAASTSIVGTVIKNIIAQDSGASAWDVSFTADTTNGTLSVTVTGAAATTIRWVCKIETTEMTY